MKKRIGALLLCLAVILTVVPLTSSAGNTAQGGEAAVKAETVVMTEEKIAELKSAPIGIGINLAYHCDAFYIYEAIWVEGQKLSTPSYLKYPNEPARLNQVAMRATESTGAWTVTGDYGARLSENAGTHVSDSFFTSPDTVEAQDGTIGLHDPTGEKVKAVLNFEEADYTAIVEQWITWAKNTGTNGFSSSEGYSDGWNRVKSVKSWVDADPKDYRAVPYVVKFQPAHWDEYGYWIDAVWFIDMVILPRERYTLGYERNLPDGYKLPDSAKFPETTTHDPGDIASVVGNPNVAPTNGSDTLEFLYWADEDGNKYGDGYASTITMVEDKVLYAMWKVSTGSLRVSKKVINPSTGDQSHADAEFDFSMTLSNVSDSDSRTFQYSVYDENAALQADQSSQFTGGFLEFKLRDGWYIQIDGLPKNAMVRITEADKDNYEALDMQWVSGSDYWYRDITIEAGSKTPTVVENIYTAPAWYTVEHYFEQSDGSYPAGPNRKEMKSDQGADGYTNAQSMISTDSAYYRLDTDHHPDGVITQEAVAADGSTVVKIYYARIRHPYQVRYLEQGTEKVLKEAVDHHGDVIGTTVQENAAQIPGYSCVSESTQSLKLQAATTENPAPNIITFWYKEDDVTINYETVGETGCGTVTPATETVGKVNGTPSSTAAANEGYTFEGWFRDPDCTRQLAGDWIENETVINPQKTDGLHVAATYYAKFQRILGTLTITQQNASDPEQVFVYQVVNTADNISMTVTVVGSGSVTIHDVPYGTYTVTQVNDWSWRHNDPPQTQKSDANGDLSYTFQNTQKNDQWLDGNSPQIDNIMTGGGNG